jgi:lipocalin
MQLVRYNGKWYDIHPKPYEPERQTHKIVWALLKGVEVNTAYRQMFEEHREHAKTLYTLRKDE